MKTKLFILLSVFLLATACSEEPPSIRVRNQRTTKANVQFKFGTSNTVNINDVAAGQTTSFKEVSEGYCVANAEIQGESVSPAIGFTVVNDKNYTLVVLEGTTPSLKVEDEDK